MSISIRVPATTANLGPGFDCLGLALDLWNEVEITPEGKQLVIQIEGEGAGVLPQDETNAIFCAMQFFAKQHQLTLPVGIHIHCTNRIPLGSGLGSSAAAAVAGLLAAQSLLNLPSNLDNLVDLATQMEGHPDNAVPCLLGGLGAAIQENGQIIYRALAIAPLWLAIVTPRFFLPTHQARAALPEVVAHQDAAFNLGHTVMVVEALRTGDLDLLKVAMQDRLHQPYRLRLIPGAHQALEAAYAAGAAAVALSGAGPSLLAVARQSQDSQTIADAMCMAFKNAGLESRIFLPRISILGAFIDKET